mmetsp:Transcript_13665/g.43679  ORF Transcript_13665/g.43679 Transcript_13665/m.43679 type:complete len:237 (+) Transcript_13665:2-712(+)
MKLASVALLVIVAASATVASAKEAVLSPTNVPPGYPPLRGEDILQYLYKLDPAVAEEFERQKQDLKAQYDEVARMAASLRKERERIAKEYPQPLKPGEEAASIDIPANHTVAMGESLLTISRKYGLSVEEIYAANLETIDQKGVKPNMVLKLPAVGKRPVMVPQASLSACQEAKADVESKLRICHRSLEVTSKERDEYKGICKINDQMEADKKSQADSVQEMQRMISELKAAKNCS